MFMFQTLKILPANVLFIEGEVFGVLFFTIVALLWLIVPFWPGKLKTSSKIMNMVGVLVIAYIMILTIWGYLV